MKWLSLLFTMLVPAVASAQIPDLIDMSAQYIPGETLEDPGLDVQVASYDAALNVPIVLNDTTFLIPGLTYHVDSVSFSNTPDDFVDLRAFHAPEVVVLGVKLLPKSWSVSARVGAGLAGDFESVDSRMLRLSGVLLATKSFGDRFVLGGGGIASWAFGELLPLPAIYIDWWVTRHLRLETFVPGFARFHALIADRVEAGIRADIAGNEYAVRDERILSSPGCAGADQSQCLDHLSYSVGVVGGEVSVRVFSSVWLRVFAGHTVFRRHEQKNAENERLAGGLQSLPNSWFVRAGLTWRIPMD